MGLREDLTKLAHGLDYLVGTDVAGDMDRSAAAKSWQPALDAAKQDYTKLSGELRGVKLQTAERVLSGRLEDFGRMGHEDIYNNLHSSCPQDISGDMDSWRRLGEHLEVEAVRFRDVLQGIFDNDWKGAAAASAKAAVEKYAYAESNLTTSIEMTRAKMELARAALQQAIERVPEVPDQHPAADAARTVGWIAATAATLGAAAPGLAAQQYSWYTRSDDATEMARAVMKSVYRPTMELADEGVPIPPASHQTVAGAPPGPPPTLAGPPPGPRPQPAPPKPVVAPKPVLPPPPTMASNVKPTQPNSHPLADLAAGKPQVPGLPEVPKTPKPELPGVPGLPKVPHVPAAVRPAMVNPFDPQRPSPLAPVPVAAAEKPGGPAAGPGSPAGPGAPGRGMAGMPGMPMMPAGRGKGQDERERKTPEYLVNAQNGKDLIGKLPKVAPPVLGA